jgi:hypothetical protein
MVVFNGVSCANRCRTRDIRKLRPCRLANEIQHGGLALRPGIAENVKVADAVTLEIPLEIHLHIGHGICLQVFQFN